MARRTINSPGTEIFERDLSLTVPQNIGTNVFVTGFTNQGPTDEVLKVTTRDELEQIYGVPTNSSERYFYYTVRELLNSPANIYTFRLPYGEGTGNGFGSQYSALVYPVRNYTNATLSTTLDVASGSYFLGEPVHFNLNETQYRQALEGSLFDWSTTSADISGLSALNALGGAGVIVLNKAQTTINGQFEGYYLGIADNTNINPATNYDAILSLKTISTSEPITQMFQTALSNSIYHQLHQKVLTASQKSWRTSPITISTTLKMMTC